MGGPTERYGHEIGAIQRADTWREPKGEWCGGRERTAASFAQTGVSKGWMTSSFKTASKCLRTARRSAPGASGTRPDEIGIERPHSPIALGGEAWSRIGNEDPQPGGNQDDGGERPPSNSPRSAAQSSVWRGRARLWHTPWECSDQPSGPPERRWLRPQFRDPVKSRRWFESTRHTDQVGMSQAMRLGGHEGQLRSHPAHVPKPPRPACAGMSWVRESGAMRTALWGTIQPGRWPRIPGILSGLSQAVRQRVSTP